ncbi:hypothetical protein F5Y12DRAFT_728148 [Xylaria sp. FL1777]|nr:hypothetical protein F5Y12DRAFT_728148 [Xylaria sp. FL1777]
MATSYLPTPPATIEILLWLNSECDYKDAEDFRERAESYCLYLLRQFSDTTQLSTEELNEATDAWVQPIVEQNSRSPIRADLVIGLVPLCFSGKWILTNVGPALWSQNMPKGPSGRALLFAYLVWRYELKAHELSLQGLTDAVENVRLNDYPA